MSMSSQSLLTRNVEFGNASDVDTDGTGWFVGFSEWAKGSSTELRYVAAGESAAGLCVKWFVHPAGDPQGEAKPLSEGRTMSIHDSSRQAETDLGRWAYRPSPATSQAARDRLEQTARFR